MPTRTNEGAVRNILTTGLGSTQILQFIADANLWVTEELGASLLSVGRLELIERYLACALIRTRDLGLSSTTLGTVSESYQVDPQVTDYLLRAAGFDTTGAVRRAFLVPKDSPTVVTSVGKGYRADAIADGTSYPEGTQ